MKPFLAILLSMLLLGEQVPLRQPLPQKSLGTTKYDVHYVRGAFRTKMATASFVLDQAVWEGESAYHASFSIHAVNLFRLIIRDQYKASLYLDRKEMNPVFYSYPHVKKGENRTLEFWYNKDKGIIESVTHVEGQEEPLVKTYTLDGITMEAASLVFFIRTIDPAALKEPVSLGLLIAGIRAPAYLSYVGEDNEYMPGKQAFHYLINLTERGLMENGSGNEIHVWVSAEPTHDLLGLMVPLGKAFMTARIR